MKNLILSYLLAFLPAQLQARVDGWTLETVIGYAIDRSGIAFQVYNGGCTQPEDFYIQVDKQNTDEAVISLYRKKRDPCKAFFPYGLTIKFGYAGLGVNPGRSFRISNPINPGFIPF